MTKITFMKAKEKILETLKANGWEVNEFLKIPWAQNKKYDIKLYFKPQAIYETQYGESFKTAMSTWGNHKEALVRYNITNDMYLSIISR